MKQKQIAQIISIFETAQAMLTEAMLEASGKQKPRRDPAELAQFRRVLIADRAAGASVAELATKYSVTRSYIYSLVHNRRGPGSPKRSD